MDTETLQQLLLIPSTPEPQHVEELPEVSLVRIEYLDDEQRKEVEQYMRQLRVGFLRSAVEK
jgi:hypothetical protein